MALQDAAPDEHRVAAAALAFALLRFEQAAAHPFPGAHPAAAPVPGIDVYTFLPSTQPVPATDVVLFLASLASPALLIPSTTRGIVSLVLHAELAGTRRTAFERIIANQSAALEEWARQLQLTDASGVLLEFAEEAHCIPLAAVRVWVSQFGVQVRWNLRSLDGDPRAQARMMLLRSDGESTWGGSCPIR